MVESPSQVSLVPSHLSRNATERRRLQGLMRTPSPTSIRKAAGQLSLKQRFNIWMINEGHRKLFIGIWCFMHVLLFCFGMFALLSPTIWTLITRIAITHYSLKGQLCVRKILCSIDIIADNLSRARAEFHGSYIRESSTQYVSHYSASSM